MTVQHNIDKLNAGLKLYAKTSGKTAEEVVRKKLGTGKGCLATELFREFKTLAPAQGEITARQTEALESGRGLKISDSVRRAVLTRYQAFSDVGSRQVLFGKFKKPRSFATVGGQRLNLSQLLVRGELKRRESSRFFTAVAARLSTAGPVNGATEAVNFLGERLGLATVEAKNGEAIGTMTIGGFGDLSQQAVHALNRPAGQDAIGRAIGNVNADLLQYLQRKLGEAAVEALKN